MTETLERLTTALADRYTIESELGAGGMATVYLAEDLKHHRKVAVKVLRPELAAVLGAERFLQEITTTANLQHPHILPLFDSGEADSFLYYVMPYIEGETLRDKLNRETQLGIDEAVRITTEVADALHYAHGENVIHRDIKPENILLHNGRPMVADFGIALAVSAAAGGRMTETGMSLGTPHYMSPEQATADKDLTNRSDIYSLGSVLYEMLAGEPPHTGASAQAIVMKIVAEEVQPVTELRKSVPPNVAAAAGKALEKLPADRFESAKAFAEALGNPAFAHGSTIAPATGVGAAGRPFTSRRVTIGVGAGTLALGIAIGAAVVRPAPPPAPVVRFRIDPPPEMELVRSFESDVTFALSPDDTYIAFVASEAGVGTSQLYVRATDRLDAVAVTGTDGAVTPFFAPDGRTVGFVSSADGKMRKVDVDGGPVTTIASDVVLAGSAPSWGDDGYIVFAGTDFRLHRVRATGGQSQSFGDSSLVRDMAERGLASAMTYPSVLPGGDAVIVSVCQQGIFRGAGFCPGTIEVIDVATGERTSLGVDGDRGWYADGYVVLVNEGTLSAARFDASRRTLDGDPVVLLDGFPQRPQVAVSASGTIAYLQAREIGDRVVVQVDRSGREEVIVAEPGDYGWVRLSPDETRIVMARGGISQQTQIHIHDRRSGTTSPITFDGQNHRPSWSPDGRRVAFSSRRENVTNIWTAPADGSAPAEPLAPGQDVLQQSATSWTRDGAWIVIDGAADNGGSAGADDIFALPVSGSGAMQPVVATPASEQTGEVSPDGQWIAYVSDDAGFFQVYLQPFLRAGGRTLVSAGAAIEPAWASESELTYVSTESGSLMLATLEFGESVRVTRTALFDHSPYVRGIPSWREYDVSRDGQRFIFTRSLSQTEARSPVAVLNWMEEVRRVMAGGSAR